MSEVSRELIADIRAASRDLVRELGFLGHGLAGTGLPASAVHAIIELGQGNGMTAKELGRRLLLEKSTISRLVGGLVHRGEVCERPDPADGRGKLLSLTQKGQATLAAITRFAEHRVAGAVGPLVPDDRALVLRGLRTYAGALAVGQGTTEPRLRHGYHPGILGRIIAWHGEFYVGGGGLEAGFEAKVAAAVSEFAGRLDRDCNGLWWFESAGQPVASIAIDGEDLGPGIAHLRWFLVTDGWRGTGLGQRLIHEALTFCDERGFAEIRLWTIKGLDAARHLYERNGFVLEEEYQGAQWGTPVTEQRFVRKR